MPWSGIPNSRQFVSSWLIWAAAMGSSMGRLRGVVGIEWSAVATVCDALLAAGERDWAQASRLFTDVLPGLPRVGGSAAQREIVEETLLFCLVNDGQAERALTLLDGRLDRRTSPLDTRRRTSLAAPLVGSSAG